jgi:hypothetical protein
LGTPARTICFASRMVLLKRRKTRAFFLEFPISEEAHPHAVPRPHSGPNVALRCVLHTSSNSRGPILNRDFLFSCAVLFLISAATLMPGQALAAEDARVLPAGRTRFSMIYAQSGHVDQNFNSASQPESITAPYNFDLSAANLIKVEPDLQKVVTVLNNTNVHYNAASRTDGSHGLTRDPSYPALGDALSRGFLGVDAQATRQQYNLSLQYGVTDRLSVGFLLPYVHNQVNVAKSFSGVNSADDAYALIKSDLGVQVSADLLKALDRVRSLDENTLQDALVARGYSRVGSSDVSGLGDMLLGGRFCYLDAHPASGQWTHSVQLGLNIPTGRMKPTGELTQVDFGSGSWDLGIAHVANYSPIPLITLTSGLHYTKSIAGHRAIRVKKDASDFLPDASSEEDLSQRLGDKYSVSAGTAFNLTHAFSIDTGYEWAWKKKDQYQGSRADRDYTYLSDDTDTHTQTFQLGATLSSIPAFLKHDLPVPIQLSANLYLPLRGRNTVIAPYGTAELDLFF